MAPLRRSWPLVFLAFSSVSWAQSPEPLPSTVGGLNMIFGGGVIVAGPNGIQMVTPAAPAAPAPSPRPTEGLPIELPIGVEAAGRVAAAQQSAGAPAVTCNCSCPPAGSVAAERPMERPARRAQTPQREEEEEPFPDVEVQERRDARPPGERIEVPEPSVPQSEL